MIKSPTWLVFQHIPKYILPKCWDIDSSTRQFGFSCFGQYIDFQWRQCNLFFFNCFKLCHSCVFKFHNIFIQWFLVLTSNVRKILCKKYQSIVTIHAKFCASSIWLLSQFSLFLALTSNVRKILCKQPIVTIQFFLALTSSVRKILCKRYQASVTIQLISNGD